MLTTEVLWNARDIAERLVARLQRATIWEDLWGLGDTLVP